MRELGIMSKNNDNPNNPGIRWHDNMNHKESRSSEADEVTVTNTSSHVLTVRRGKNDAGSVSANGGTFCPDYPEDNGRWVYSFQMNPNPGDPGSLADGPGLDTVQTVTLTMVRDGGVNPPPHP